MGDHALTVNAFVARNPDENHAAVYRWLLERNRRMFGVAFAVDHLGDIYLVGRLPLGVVTAAELDRLLGSVLQYADDSFNTILGWASRRRSDANGTGGCRAASRRTTCAPSPTSPALRPPRRTRPTPSGRAGEPALGCGRMGP